MINWSSFPSHTEGFQYMLYRSKMLDAFWKSQAIKKLMLTPRVIKTTLNPKRPPLAMKKCCVLEQAYNRRSCRDISES